MAGILPSFSAFDPDTDQTSVSQRWTKWLNKFENMLKALAIKDDQRKRALLLHYVGDRVYDIFETLSETGNDYETAKTKLTAHFKPRQNTAMEIMIFRRAKQMPNETVDQYHTRLQALSANCRFPNRDEEIKQQIIATCSSSRLR